MGAATSIYPLILSYHVFITNKTDRYYSILCTRLSLLLIMESSKIVWEIED